MKNITTRNTVRKSFMTFSLVLFPLTFYFFSPYICVDGSISGIISGSLLIFSLQFLTALFFGRSFCSWLCPAGALQDVCLQINDKPLHNGKKQLIKYMIWIPWISTMIILFVKSYPDIRIDFLHSPGGGPIFDFPQYFISYFFVMFIFIASVLSLGRRGFCHTGCWMAPFMIIGNKIGKLLPAGQLHLASSKSKCRGCQKCTRSCPMSLSVSDMVKSGKMDDKDCILCGECADNCPYNAIKFSFNRRHTLSSHT